MSDLLLITDMARLIRIFDRLADDGTLTLRVVNNLERGGEEIVFKKPDVVFVQTHLSGLSADILLMHLKKQLGRKRSRFVLLATPGQVNNQILKPYHGWLDISCKDSELLPTIQNLLTSLLSKTRASDGKIKPEAGTLPVSAEPVAIAETSAPLNMHPTTSIVQFVPGVSASPAAPATVTEASLQDQGITYSPRSRLSVYSDFNSSFDNAVSSTPEAESLVKASPMQEHNWNSELIDTIETVSPRSKISTFLLWLAPVVVAVVVVTFLQKNRSVSKPDNVTAPPVVSMPSSSKTVGQPVPATVLPAEPSKPSVTAKLEQDSKIADKAVITAIAENRVSPPRSTTNARPSTLPEFIPRNGVDKQYGTTNPGWERYMGDVTEFKVLREAQTIKVIQIIDRGGQGVPESFMKSVLRQVAKKTDFTVETTEKKEGYEIQRGHISENLKVVYYRDEQGGKLRAFVMNWQ